MLILLDCRPLQDAGAKSERTRFILACIAALTDRHGVEWLFLLDRKRADLLLPEGGKRLVRTSLPGRPGTRLWYDWLIPRAARRYKADQVMTTDGRPAGGTSTPQCSWTLTGKGFMLSCSGMEAQVPLAPDEEAGIVNLLKAFSLFKKRQLSNMKLVLAGAVTIDKLDSYKYRQDVSLCPETRRDQAAGAYAVINLPRRNNLGIAVPNAWKAGVPVITTSMECIPASEEAVLLVPPDDPVPLADGLKSLYKDEAFRKGLMGKAEVRARDFGVQRSVAAIWGVLGKGDGN